MLRITRLAVLALALSTITARAQTYAELLAEGKKQIKEQRDMPDASYTPDYTKALEFLRKAVNMCPDSPEAHYFLGSAIDYNGNPDGSKMNRTTRANTLLASAEFEKVNQLSPKYNGQKVLLGPYTKIGSIWGCLAIAYMARNDYDSARWAFKEGKKRGGYGDFTLNFYRYLLNSCPHNAILFTDGDMCTMALWYLQEIENVRADVAVLDVNMIQVPWYNAFLYQKHASLFSSPKVALDTTLYAECPRKPIVITDRRSNKQLRWLPQSRQNSGYLYLGDFILIDIVRYNKFERPVYFTYDMNPENQAGLTSYLRNRMFISRLVTDSLQKTDFNERLDLDNFPFDILASLNVNNQEEMANVTSLQYKYLTAVTDLVRKKQKSEAAHLFTVLTTNLPEEKFPYPTEEIKEYVHEMADKFKDN